MSDVGEIEDKTQGRVIKLFAEMLDYEHLGDWRNGDRTSGIETDLLTLNLRARDYDTNLINRALDQLDKAAAVGPVHDFYAANRTVHHCCVQREG